MKALFLGLGGVGQRHLRNLRHLRPEAAVAAVRHSGRTFEITPELKADHTTNIVEKYAISEFTDLDAAIADFAPDIAIVSTPSNTHAALASRLVAARVPVFLEKPISHDRESLDQLLDALHGSSVPVMVGYMLRYHPAVRHLKAVMEAGGMGRLTGAHVVANTYMPGWHPYEGVGDFYAGRKDLGGGTILTNIHLIDLLHWMLGAPERLWCVGGTLASFEIDVEDTVGALFEFRRDGRSVPATLNLSFVQRPVENTMTFRFEAGEVRWDLATQTVVRNDVEAGETETKAFGEFGWNDMFVAEMEHFLDCVAAGRRPDSDVRTVAGGHAMALALATSLETGQVVAS